MFAGNNPASICKNCAGQFDAKCTSNDPYSGYVGAFNCMASGTGDVAFLRHSTLREILGDGGLNSTGSENVRPGWFSLQKVCIINLGLIFPILEMESDHYFLAMLCKSIIHYGKLKESRVIAIVIY